MNKIKFGLLVVREVWRIAVASVQEQDGECPVWWFRWVSEEKARIEREFAECRAENELNRQVVDSMMEQLCSDQEERNRLRAENAGRELRWLKLEKKWNIKLQECEADAKRLRDALEKYGNHTAYCNGMLPTYTCDCGWKETREALRGEGE
jgi:hypothetical protein